MHDFRIGIIGAAICFAFIVLSAIICVLIQIAMVEDINSKAARDAQLSWLSRDHLRILRQHRRYFPDSPLRRWFITALLLVTFGGMAFVLLVGLQLAASS